MNKKYLRYFDEILNNVMGAVLMDQQQESADWAEAEQLPLSELSEELRGRRDGLDTTCCFTA